MNDQRDILTTLASHLILALEPLQEAFSEEERFKGFLYRLGWDVGGLPQEYIELSASVASAVAAVQALVDKELSGGSVEASDVAGLVAAAKDLYERISGLSTAPPGVDSAAFLGEIGERLFELLLTEYLSRNQVVVFNLFSALDIIELENLGDTGSKHAYVRLKFKWSEIPEILQDPLSIVQRVYGWGTNELDAGAIFNHLSGLFYGLGFPVNLIRPRDDLILAYNEAEDLPFSRAAQGLKVPFYYTFLDDQPIELSFELLELPPGNGNLPGLVLQPGIPSEFPFEFQLGNDVDLKIKAGSDIGSRFGVFIRPDGLGVKYPFQDSASFPSAGFGIEVDFHPPDALVLFGTPDGIRMQMKGAKLGLEVISVSGEFEVKALSELKELSLILAAGNADGFLQTILGDGEIKVDIPLGIDWSSKTGFGFRGSMNFEIALHPHLSLGPIEISQFQLSLAVPMDKPDPTIDIEAGINVNGNLGPLKFVVEEVGLGLYTTFKEGNLGPLNLDVGFKPPNGIGLSVDAGAVKGGGYLYFDFDNERYAGALELVFSGTITLKAVGLITTRMPDGSKGFSLLVIITAEFGSPIQLGLGFTLSGVGGLLGLNRTMKLEPLAEGIRTGAANSIMFPTNVIENAPRIISDLRTFFPPQVDIFLVGPMAKLGWGTPNLVTLSLGIIIEIPGNIAIVGVLRLILPDEKAALLKLQVNFIGAIEFDKKRAWFFASLFESRVLYITIEGEMGILVDWSKNPNFVVSVGGFHPAFSPPPLPFPEPKRIALNILNTDFAKIRVEGYFAVTSNTVQFGARAELFFGLSEFKIEGHLAFDALFQFSPFYMIIEISASLSVKVFGIGLFSIRIRGSLEGPAPWHIEGTGSISLLFFDIDVDFSHNWGEEKDTTLPPITLMPLVKAEFEKLENWKAEVPAANRLSVSLRELDLESALVLHPVGALTISQRYVPLELTLDKVGAQKPSDANYFSLNVSGGTLKKQADQDESFSIAQFKEMEDAKKLSSPAYEPRPGGGLFAVDGQPLKTDRAVKRVVRYEQIIIDTNYKRFVRPFFKFFGVLFALFLRGNVAAKSPFSHQRFKQKVPFADKVAVQLNQYVVAFNADNSPFNAQATFTSHAKADEFMRQQVANDPNLADSLHVIPRAETKAAA